ncbi:MAG: polyprenyl synthetase family protein [Prevotellaceae bacterium]|nr:polyprenyl synthetase family protein [Candidatus Faecinaster equi]
MYNFSQLIEQVNKSIANIDYPHQPEGLYEPIQYVLSLGGKRIRPVFMLLASQLYDADLAKIMPAAVGLEVYHNYTLLHDDLMDRADMRRGKLTVHKKWNDNTAILSGDTMLVMACNMILSVRQQNTDAMNVFVKTALEIGEGQQFDMNFETRQDVTTDEYIKMIRLKTSVLIGCATKMGAILANAPKEDIDKLYDLGEKVGLAFQLQDDLLDVYGDPKVFGKRIGGDILCNKKTFMLINALLLSNDSQRKELQKWLDAKEYDEQEKINAITAIYNELNIREVATNIINKYFDEAKKVYNSLNVPEEKKALLWDFVKTLVNREV